MNVYVSLCTRGAMQYAGSHGAGCVVAPIPRHLRHSKDLDCLAPLPDPCLGPTNPSGMILSEPRYLQKTTIAYILIPEEAQYTPGFTVKPSR